MYIGVSCPVSRRNIEVGMVRIVIWKYQGFIQLSLNYEQSIIIYIKVRISHRFVFLLFVFFYETSSFWPGQILEGKFEFEKGSEWPRGWGLKKGRKCTWSLLTSPIDVASRLTILSWGTATTLWPLISIIRWPTRTPPLSAIPPRKRLHICKTYLHQH